MSVPIIYLDVRPRQFCETFRKGFSQPQFKYRVTVRPALMLRQETHTLTGLLRQIVDGQSLSGSITPSPQPETASVVVVCPSR